MDEVGVMVSKEECVPGLVPSEESVRLDVSSLDAGSYAVDVNVAVRSFTLERDQ